MLALAFINGTFAFMTYGDVALKHSFLKITAMVLFWFIILAPSLHAAYGHGRDVRQTTGYGAGIFFSAALIIFVTIFATKKPNNV